MMVRVLLALATVISCARVAAQDSAPGRPGAIEIGEWNLGVDPGDAGRRFGGRLLFPIARFHAGDSLDWGDPAYDDSEWEIASIGLRADILPSQGWPGIGWFRTRVRLDSSLSGNDIGFAVQHAGAIELYLDGELAYRSGTVGQTRSDEVPRLDSAPFSLPVLTGGEHVLAIRYSNHVSKGFRQEWSFAGPAVYWGDLATMVRHRGFVRFDQGVFSSFFVAFAMLFMVLFGLYRTERLFLYLAILYGLVIPFGLIGGQLHFVSSPAWVMPMVDTVFAFAVAALIAELVVVYAFFYDRRPKLFYAFCLLGLMVIAAVVGRLDNIVFFALFLLLISAEMVRVIALALWRRRRWAWIVAAGVIPSIVLQIWTQFELFGLGVTPWSGSPLNPAVLSSICYAAAFAVYVGVRFAEAGKGLAELEAARTVQLSMVPESLPTHPGVELAASMQTASQVGGDYYDFDVAEDGSLTVVVGDATGHGTKAGIMVTATKSLWTAYHAESNLEDAMQRVDVALKQIHLPGLYMALALARFRRGVLEIVGAGLPPALIHRAKTGDVEAIPLKGMPLGGPGKAPRRMQRVPLQIGDTVALMTDGLPEQFNKHGEMFGYERAIREFEAAGHLPPEQIIDHLVAQCESWANGHARSDDVTFVVLRLKEATLV